MTLLRKWFKPKKISVTDSKLHQFGRYSDAYRSDGRQRLWNKSVDHFEKKNYQLSIKTFLDFLKDEETQNITYSTDEQYMDFEVLQGSKKIEGKVNGVMIELEVKVASCKKLTVGFMKRLMEKNYELKYGRFALDRNNDIAMKFETHLIDASPYKLYEAFKEVATNTDKLDDLLVDEFEELTSIDTGHIQEIEEEEKEVKYQFINHEITNTLNLVKSLDDRKVASGIAYLLLHLNYKLDYLVRPEGYIMEVLERVHRLYFAHDNRTIAAKCKLLSKELVEITERSEEDIKKEFYHVVATFGITGNVTHERVQSFIDGELPAMDWFLRNDYPQIALSIPGYIIGYCLFNFTLPKLDRELFHLYFEITEGKYFNDLGFEVNYYNPETKKLNRSAIKSRVSDIIKSNKTKQPYLNPDLSILKFTTLPEFGKSYLTMITELDLLKK